MHEPHVVCLDIPASHKFLGIVSACLGELLSHYEVDSAVLYQVQLAVHETCTNIVDHAYPPENDGRIWITLSLAEQKRGLTIDVRDAAPKTFELKVRPEPTLEQERGRGLFLIQKIMDEVYYHPETGNNRWRLVKNF